MMKLVYLICMSLLVIIMILCIIYAVKKNAKCSGSITVLLMSAIFSVSMYMVYLIVDTEKMALLFKGMYFIGTTWMTFFLLKFIFVYLSVKKYKKQITYVLLVLVSIDSICLLINNRNQFMFSLDGTYYNYSSGKYYADIFKWPHYLHLALCYVIVAMAVALIIKNAIYASKLYKIKNMYILLPLIMVIVINAVCYTIKAPIDISVLMYSLIAVSICYVALKAVPRELVSKAQYYLAENVKQGLICFEEKGDCIYRNKTLNEVVDFNDKAIVAKISTYFNTKHYECLQNNVDFGEWEEVFNVKGEERNVDINYKHIFDDNKKSIGYYFVIEDRTDDIKKLEEEKFKATHDHMTGLLNRESFFEQADAMLNEDRNKQRYILASDIKDFKLINNLYGQEFGDRILKMQAGLIKQFLSEDSIAGRIAGDKFAIVMNKENYNEDVFRKCVEEINKYTGDNKFNVRFHIGKYDITGCTENAQVLYNRVGVAISTIHNDYEKVFVDYVPEMMQKIIKEKQMVNEFDKCLSEKQFCMYLQPQVSNNGNILGAEALVRWHHPEKGIIYPGDFIEVFEKANMIQKLDLEIWNQAAEKLKEWKDKGYENLHISINISTRDFYYLDVYKELVQIVEKYEINPHNLKLEITESAVMIDGKENFRILSKLKKYGFELELDDFGSGYSSLNMLKDFDVDVLKIDRMFLKETGDEKRGEIILEMVISLAKNLGMQIVSEGVEEKAQIEKLTQMGCDIFQGYYYDKPIQVGDFEKKYL